MKNRIIFGSIIIAIIVLSSVILAGCMDSIADDNGETKPYDITESVKSITSDISVITESNTPTPQETMRKKFAEMSAVDEKEKSITVITTEYLKKYWSDGKLRSLTEDEILFVIQDSIRMCEKYDKVILPAFTNITTGDGDAVKLYYPGYGYSSDVGKTDYVIETKYSSMKELKTFSEYNEFKDAVSVVILYRMVALSSPGAFICNSEAISYYGGDPAMYSSLYPEGYHYICGYPETKDRKEYYKYFAGGNYKEEIDMTDLINSGVLNMIGFGGSLGSLSMYVRSEEAADPSSSFFNPYTLKNIFPTAAMEETRSRLVEAQK
ncbi:MAG: hypothetical protein IJS94_05700 [Clostridia bacterium]|nr:hypothetical protein [Clostridia bacterium]